MKKVPTILLLLVPYAFIAVFLNFGLTKDVFLLWPILWLVICLPNMVYAFLLPRLGATPRQLLFWDMVLKLCNIPIFAGVFLIALLLNIMVIPLLPFLMLFDYSLLLPSSMYGISGIWQNYQKGKFSAVETAVNIILHFFFCADVFSSIYCYLRGRKVSQSNASLIEGGGAA